MLHYDNPHPLVPDFNLVDSRFTDSRRRILRRYAIYEERRSDFPFLCTFLPSADLKTPWEDPEEPS